MDYNTDCFEEVFPLLKDFLYHLTSYREIVAILDQLPGEREFWVYTCDAHIKNAALSWCMVFGTDSNETHWKKIFKSNSYDAKQSFLNYLYKNEGINHKCFYKYWKEMTEFRNNYVAHKTGYCKPVPSFDMACLILFSFDTWIRKQIKPDVVDFPTFKKLTIEYRLDISSTLKKLINE